MCFLVCSISSFYFWGRACFCRQKIVLFFRPSSHLSPQTLLLSIMELPFPIPLFFCFPLAVHPCAPRFGLLVASLKTKALIGTDGGSERERNLIAFSMRFTVEYNFFVLTARAPFYCKIYLGDDKWCLISVQAKKI